MTTKKLFASFVIVCSTALMVGTISAEAGPKRIPESCAQLHPGAGSYCRAIMHRKAIRIIRHKERVEAKRLGQTLSFHPLKAWNVSKLWRANRWERHRLAILKATPTPIPYWDEWMCIAGYESNHIWTMTPYSSPSSGGPYWGGLQMDISFQHTWGADMLARHHGGLANTWTPEEQVIVANRAREHRGWQPWPQTSLMCGLSY